MLIIPADWQPRSAGRICILLALTALVLLGVINAEMAETLPQPRPALR